MRYVIDLEWRKNQEFICAVLLSESDLIIIQENNKQELQKLLENRDNTFVFWGHHADYVLIKKMFPEMNLKELRTRCIDLVENVRKVTGRALKLTDVALETLGRGKSWDSRTAELGNGLVTAHCVHDCILVNDLYNEVINNKKLFTKDKLDNRLHLTINRLYTLSDLRANNGIR